MWIYTHICLLLQGVYLLLYVTILFYNKGVKSRNAQDRLVFARRGQQTKFLFQAKNILALNWEEMGKIVDAHPRSLRDWAREKHEMAYRSALLISKKTGIKIPETARVKKWSEHMSYAGSFGWKAIKKKYGRVPTNEKLRQEKWKEWWDAKGKFLPSPIHNTLLSFHVPQRSKKLAEFVGIMMGDGGVSKYQLAITLHRYDDRLYSYFVKRLIKELFNLKTTTVRRKKELANTIMISRIKLVEYAIDSLGLVLGNKVRQEFDIPGWIKRDKEYLIACMRGLFDTDGSVFTHTYVVKGKEYSYKKLSFTSASLPLRLTVFDFLHSLGISCRLAGDNDVRIDSKASVERYFRIIGSSNPKHLKRYGR
jgi:hypothetical protein